MRGDSIKLVKMSFSKEIEDFDDDGFEGSMDERHIFTEVFFGKDSGRCKKFLVNRVINFECNKSKHKDLLCVNSENSSLTSHEDSYHINEDTKQCFGQVCSSEGHTTLMRNHPDMNGKRMKLSVDELCGAKCYMGKVFKYSDCSKGVISTCQSDSDSISQRVTCLVESSTQGLTSSCYMLGQQGDMDTGDMTDNVAALCKFSEEDGSEKKEAVAKKVIASPISQESYVTKVLIASSSVGIENMSVSGRCPKPKWKDSCFVQLDVSEMSLVRESPNDPRPLLRYYTHQLLRAAGWVIGRRKRSNKFHGLGEYVFKSPEGRPIREFRRAWKFCGERLFENANNMMKLTDDKKWTSMNQFWSDLSLTLREFEERLNNMSSFGVLSYCWCLLDPFAHVVFIDKKLGSLKAGKVVKSMRSLLIDSYAKDDEVITSGCKFLVDNVGGAGSKYGEISGNERSQFDQCSLPAYGSESTWDQNGTGQSEFPISSRKANISAGVSDIVSPCQGSNTSSAFCGELRSGHDDRMPSSVIKNVCNGSYKRDQLFEQGTDKLKDLLHKSMDNRSNQMNGFIDAISKRKAHKKLKKISEIKLSGLYPNGNLGQSTFCKVESHDISTDNIPLQPGVQECLISTVASDGSCKKSALCSSQQRKKKKQNEFKMLSHSGNVKQVVKYRLPKDPDFVNIEDGKETVLHGKHGQKKSYACQLEDDDLLISAVINNKSSRYASKRPTSKRISCKSNALRKRRSQKGRCRLLPRSFNKGGKHFMEGKWFAFGLRTVLSWLINSGVVSLNKVIQYRNLKDDSVVKDGLVTKDGILCRCCDKMFSISEFKCHAGFKLNRTCLNLFMESGKPFTLCLLEAWSAEYKTRKSAIRTVQVNELDQNDDSCGLCGDGGELLCCDNCPSTFHQACLFAQELPEGNWYCQHCTCQICGDLANVKQILKSFGGLQCLQCENKYHEACLSRNSIRATSDSWFCSEGCQEVYSGLSSRVGFMNLISDGFYWTILRCIHGDQKVHSAQRFIAMKAECNSKLAVALTIMEECFLPMVDPRTGIDMIPHVLYNWGSQFARLNYSGFYTVVLEKDDVLISVASLRIHGVRVAEMPLIATCSKYRRQGMCRRLMNSIEKMLRVFKVEMLVISAIPSLVETWTVGFGFKPLEDTEKSGLNKINLMVFPGTIWLKKSLLANQENQKMGRRQMLPSATNYYAENGHWPKGNASNEPAPLTERNLPCEVFAVIENVCPDSMNVQVGGELDSNLHEHFPKLSYEEATSMSKDMELALVSHVESESLELYEEQPSFHKHSDKTCASQEIEK